MQEYLQVPQADELRRIRDYGIHETLIALIAPQLRLAILSAAYGYGVQPDVFSQDRQDRVKAYLPFAVQHLPGNYDIEPQVYLSVPLRHVPETGINHGRIKDIVRNHLSVLIPYRIHYQHFPTVRSGHFQGIAVLRRYWYFQWRGVIPVHFQLRGDGFLPEALRLEAGAAGNKRQERKEKRSTTFRMKKARHLQ